MRGKRKVTWWGMVRDLSAHALLSVAIKVGTAEFAQDVLDMVHEAERELG
jgi:hypothetical protein